MGDRIEHDALGEVAVPESARWGAQTQRAVENFPISGTPMPPAIITMLGTLKAAAATVNGRVGAPPPIDAALADAIRTAADEVAAGEWADQFPIDVFQTGSGTSTNMNANEVIAHRAAELVGHPVHPNDDVNASQSSNDVIPTVIRLAVAVAIRDDLLPAIAELVGALRMQSERHSHAVKAGRTHLMDAAPLFIGQEVGAWASQLETASAPLVAVVDHLSAVPLGGSAVGTGLNVPDGWADAVLAELADRTRLAVRPSADRFAAMAGGESYAEASSACRGVAVALTKIANDLRWLSSGPATGLAELRLPALQPGSSIMPGKVNPVLPEATVQVAARVMGNDATISIAASQGNFQLNTYLPLIAATLIESVSLLSKVTSLLATRCVAGLTFDEGRARRYAEASPALITGLATSIGYERAAAMVLRADREARTLRELLADDGFSDAEISRALDAERLARGGVDHGDGNGEISARPSR